MKNRLELAKKLLKEDGSIWINIDDDESHYLKVLCDEVFNRSNFIANIIWKKKYSPQNDARYFSDMHDHILVYSKNRKLFKVKGLPRSEEMNSRYINMDNDPRGRWKTGDFSVRTYSKNNDYPIVTPSGKVINPPKGRCWRASEEKFNEMVKDNRIWFGKDGSNVPAVKRFLSEVKQSVTPQTIWDYSEVGHNQDARKEILGLKFKNTDFSTPKPEALLQRVINISSNKLDIILDFFMGSATTQSAALKMHRKFIGIEQMNYIEDIAVERLKKVIDGEQGGISKDEGWEGGESFVYCELKEVGNTLISDIENATEDTIKVLKEKLFSNESIVPYITTNELMEVERDFNNLTLKDKKKALALLVDKNKLYINYSDINDESLEITESERKFTKSFYEGNSND